MSWTKRILVGAVLTVLVVLVVASIVGDLRDREDKPTPAERSFCEYTADQDVMRNSHHHGDDWWQADVDACLHDDPAPRP